MTATASAGEGPPLSPDRPPAAAAALERGLSVLEYTAARGSTSPAEVSRDLGLSRSATYRLIERLCTAGWLAENPGGGVKLGPRSLMLGTAAMGQSDLLQLARPLLRALAAEAGDTVNLGVPDGDFMTYVAQQEGPEAVRVTARLGTRRPMNCSALGKAYLAALPPAELDVRLAHLQFVQLTERSLMDAESLRHEVLRTRHRGYAIDDLEVEPGVACFAAAVLDFRGLGIAAISVAGPVDRIRAREQPISSAVRDTALALSTQLGFTP